MRQRSSPHVRSTAAPSTLACSRRWAQLVTATTTPSSSRSGAECKSSSSTANAGALASSSPTRSSNTWKSSTTASAVTPRLACSHQSSSRLDTNQRQWRENPTTRLHETKGTSEPLLNPGRFTVSYRDSSTESSYPTPPNPGQTTPNRDRGAPQTSAALVAVGRAFLVPEHRLER